MPRPSPVNPLVIKLENWPAEAQARWRAGTASGRSLDGDKYAATLRAHTVRNAMRGYGRYLAFLAASGDNDLHALSGATPEAGVTPERLEAYVAHLRAAGNVANTIATRIWDLRAALEIMTPGRKFRWITSPGGNAIRALLPQLPRAIVVRHSKDLVDWGVGMMDAAGAEKTPLRQAARFRDGLIIAVFAQRGPRLESLSRIRIGLQFRQAEDGYWLDFRREDMKNKKPLSYPLSARLQPYVRRYLAEARPTLLRGQRHDWLWVNQSGARLGKRGIEGMIRRATQACFGETFGPHRFRHAAGTIGPIADPTKPAAVAAMLGASPAVVEAYYNLGNQQLAARKFHENLRREREKTAGLAERLLAGRF